MMTKATNNNSLVSIITPTYNHEKFIGSCIESVLAQTYPNWELIIIDDGSTDGTADVISRYKDKRIRYLRQENKGLELLAETYNKALSLAKGDLIAILEGDDFWPDYKLELQVKDFEDKEVILSFGYTRELGPDGKLLRLIPDNKIPDGAKKNFPIGKAAISMLNPNWLTFTFPVSVLVRRKALERIGGFQHFKYLPLVDYPTFLQLTLQGKFAFNDKIVGFWRRHRQSATSIKFLLIMDGVQKYIKFFLQEKGSLLTMSIREKKKIEKEWKSFHTWHFFLSGRRHLVNKKWKEARKFFMNGLRQVNRLRVVLVMLLSLGIILSYLHLNLEPLFQLCKRPTIDRIHMDGSVKSDQL